MSSDPPRTGRKRRPGDGCPRDAGHVCPRTKHAGVTRIGIIIWPSLPLVVGVAAVAFNAVYKAAKRATNSEAVVPGEEAPYRLRIVAWDRKKITCGLPVPIALKALSCVVIAASVPYRLTVASIVMQWSDVSGRIDKRVS